MRCPQRRFRNGADLKNSDHQEMFELSRPTAVEETIR
jgi:hypothetical protein